MLNYLFHYFKLEFNSKLLYNNIDSWSNYGRKIL